MTLLSRISPNARTPLACLLILLGIFFSYAQVGGHSFVEFDDGLYLFNNRMVIEGLTWSNVVWSFTNIDAANWHPLTWISLLVDRELFGPRPGGYLLMNVALHGLASCLCFIAFKNTTRSTFAGLTIAFLFALHPANVENVAWISSRKSILDAIFWFAGILLYIKYLDSKEKKFLLLTFIMHLMGLMCKSMHVTFPFTLWIIHFIYLHNKGDGGFSIKKWIPELKRCLWITCPMIFISGYFSFITLVAQEPALSSLPLDIRSINAIISYERYVQMFFNPKVFAPFYPFFFEDINLKQIVRPIITIAVITAFALLLAIKKNPIALAGWCWYIGCMIPVIGFVQVGAQSHADRYLYIPGIGLGILFTSLFNSALPTISLRNGLKYISFSIIALSTTAITKIQVSYWKDGVTLFKHSLEVTGDCMTSVISLSAAYTRQNRFDEGINFLTEKINVAKNPTNRASLLLSKGTLLLAKAEYQKALLALQQSLDLGLKSAKLYCMIADALIATDNLDKAQQFLDKARTHPPEPYQNVNFSNFFLSVRIDDLQQILDQKKAASE